MRIAIAGASSFIGRELTAQLLAEDAEVVWLSRRPARTPAPDGVRQATFDHHDQDGPWAAEIAAADAVVNLSGHPIASRWNAAVKHALRDSRIGTNRAIVRALADAHAADPNRERVLVSASGIGYYGDRGDAVLDEGTEAGADFLGQLAAEWESAALEAARAGSARVVCVRTGLVLGSEGLVPRLALPMRLFVGGPVGLHARRQWVGWIHHADIAAVYRYAIATPTLSGPVNAVAPEPATMHAFSATLGRVMRRPSWLPVPGLALKIILGEVAPYMLFSQRATPAALTASGFEFAHPHLPGALTDVTSEGPRRDRV